MRRWIAVLLFSSGLQARIAIRGDLVYTMAGPPIADGVVLVREGKIERVGAASLVPIPDGYRMMRAKVVTPGLIDARTVVGLAGWLNQAQDQEQLERSAAIQPELRAIDAYNPRDELVAFLRKFGITTIHTGHAPGALVSGQTMIVKTYGGNVEKALVKAEAMVAAALGAGAKAEPGKSPGSNPKAVAMLRGELVRAQEYAAKKEKARDLKLEVLARVLSGELPLLINVNRAHDILTALRIASEFRIRLVLDSAAEAYEVIDSIRASGFPVILHPTMARAAGDLQNVSVETAAKLVAAGIPVALQSGYESYVPKTRVVLFEAALAAANGLTREQALALITREAARLLGIEARVGTLETGKDADLALYDGDPFEHTSHCIGVIINGEVASESPI
ncbi:MAG: amidohydrolase family protein [Bryobacteraceae bacterium]|nr:amidohydrolase family protein [Bryobacteraceae bacterium]MDW8378044.1 amidohydrolase family protein [Bryobacterales bacterium]